MIVPGTNKEAHKLIDSAATELVVRFPLAGLSLYGRAVAVVQHTGHATAATDGRSIFCNPEFFLKMSASYGQTIVSFILLHEWIHIFFNHMGRMGSRIPDIWNMAADYYTNYQCEILLNMKTPATALKPRSEFFDKTVEQIYDMLVKQGEATNKKDPVAGLKKSLESELKDTSVANGSDMIPDPGVVLPPVPEEDFKNVFIEEVIENQGLMDMGPTKLTNVFRERFEQLKEGRIPWERLVVGRVMADLGHDCATYSPPNRRRLYPLIILPSYRALKERKLLLGIDVSYSVGQELMRLFISSATSAARRATETRIVTFDSIVREDHKTQDPATILKKVRFISGAHSHTSVRGLFEIAEEYEPRSIAVLTDGYVDLPNKPYRNTLWLVPRGGRAQPWGTTYTLDITW